MDKNNELQQMKRLEFAMELQDKIMGDIIRAQEKNPKIKINYTTSDAADKFFDKAYNAQTTENFNMAIKARYDAISDLNNQSKSKGIKLTCAEEVRRFLDTNKVK